MKYIRLKTTDPYYNLATEEYLFKNSPDDVFMLWQNRPSVIIGKNQNAYAEVNLAYAKDAGISVCRRITGGGAVYHDLGNINYTFISVGGKREALDFEYFTRPIISVLSEMGVEARLGGRNDIECGGLKISGNAQYADGGRLLHHGTLLFDVDVEKMSLALKVDKEKLAYRAVKSCRARVTNLRQMLGSNLNAEDFIAQIESRVCRELGAVRESAPQCEEVDFICRRNAPDSWIYSEKRFLTDYSVRRKKKYPFGIVEIELDIAAHTVKRAVISGDFFGTAPIEELEAALVGINTESPSFINPAPYIAGMSFSELAELLREAK